MTITKNPINQARSFDLFIQSPHLWWSTSLVSDVSLKLFQCKTLLTWDTPNRRQVSIVATSCCVVIQWHLCGLHLSSVCAYKIAYMQTDRQWGNYWRLNETEHKIAMERQSKREMTNNSQCNRKKLFCSLNSELNMWIYR